MEERESIVFYKGFYDAINELPTDSDKVKIYEAIMQYSFYGTEIELEGYLKGYFSLMKKNIDKAKERYETNVKNGQKGGAPRGNSNAKKSKTTENNQKQPKNNPKQPKNNLNVNDNDNDNVNDNVNVNDNNNDNDNESVIIKTYEEEIGAITPINADVLCSYLDTFPVNVITLAIKKASMSNKRTTNYIKGILNNWHRQNLHTVLDIENSERHKDLVEEKREESISEWAERMEKEWAKDECG